MFKILRLQSCPTLQDNLKLEYPNHHYDTRPCGVYYKLQITNYKYHCSKVWNGLPVSLRNASSMGELNNNNNNVFFHNKLPRYMYMKKFLDKPLTITLTQKNCSNYSKT